jgi:1-phosphofructokinase family hexose kinase
VRTRSDTRANLEIIARDGTVTEILEPGGGVTEGEIERLVSACRDIFAESGKASQVVLSGSLPPGAPADLYAELIRLAHAHGCRVLLDTSGDALREGLVAAPDLVKPNRAEASTFAARPVSSAAQAAEVAQLLINAGARSVAVSLGADGIVWEGADKSTTVIAQALPVVGRSTVGCGDAALAGFAVAYERGLSARDALSLAVACGTANCLADSPGLVDPREVDRIMQEVVVQPLTADWPEVKMRGGTG